MSKHSSVTIEELAALGIVTLRNPSGQEHLKNGLFGAIWHWPMDVSQWLSVASLQKSSFVHVIGSSLNLPRVLQVTWSVAVLEAICSYP
jgi:hypothetical protein